MAKNSGKNHYNAKLTDRKVREIRMICDEEVRAGRRRPLGALAKKYGVSKNAIVLVAARATWAHVAEVE